MAWEEELFALFDDLESQAEALYGREREAELVDRARVEYQQVTLASRLMASVSHEIGLEVRGLGRLHGHLRRVGHEWCLLEAGGVDWVVRAAGVSVVHGPSPRSLPEVAWSPVSRLGFGSACRRLSDASVACLIHLVDGTRHEAVILRVGQDFLEIATPSGAVALVQVAAVAAISSPPVE